MVLLKKNLEINSFHKDLLLEKICIHEAGHAVVALKLQHEVKEIVANENEAFTKTVCRTDGTVINVSDIKEKIMVCYGGPAAEKVFYDEISEGCIGTDESDMQQASSYIKDMLLISEEYNGCGLESEDISNLISKKSIELFNLTKKIIKNNEELILLIAGELKKRGKLNELQLKYIIKHNKGNL